MDTQTPPQECECGVQPSVFYLLATLLLTSCSTAMLCASIMTDHWEHVVWERAALAALANASSTTLQWLLDEKVAKGWCESAACECGIPKQTIRHMVLECPNTKFNGSFEELKTLNGKAVDYFKTSRFNF
ncbi:uncharacterized protein LOC125233352 [Leguminivora glycinivorella]|uniref:uncharacterized protein LOC125233352 n=1 Tax=Leguminivora glycinivorella TaxID=1035111 RepID=UPI00200D4A45|nr:uncharacterized protein LOC125233352 [Leguminivora glycinivorella]